jgi:hypothetical protein
MRTPKELEKLATVIFEYMFPCLPKDISDELEGRGCDLDECHYVALHLRFMMDSEISRAVVKAQASIRCKQLEESKQDPA